MSGVIACWRGSGLVARRPGSAARRDWRRRLSVLGVAVVTVGCGVPLQDSAQPLPPEVIPPPIVIGSNVLSPSPTASQQATLPPGVEVVDFYFIREDGLVAVASDVASPASPDVVLSGLEVGPASDSGLRSVVVDPLTATPLVAVFVPSGEVGQLPIADVTIAVSGAFGSLPSAEQVLLLGQVVLSLSSAGLSTVSVVDETGSPLAVPLPDGRLLDRPATALDYAALRRPR